LLNQGLKSQTGCNYLSLIHALKGAAIEDLGKNIHLILSLWHFTKKRTKVPDQLVISITIQTLKGVATEEPGNRKAWQQKGVAVKESG